jgi:hypothetical protein
MLKPGFRPAQSAKGRSHRKWQVAGVLLAVMSAEPGLAQEARVSVLGSARFEDNVRRFSDEAQEDLPANGADEVFYLAGQGFLATRVGGFTDVTAQASAGYTWFSKNSDLDAFDYSLRLRADRSTPRNSVTITLEQLRRRIDLQELNFNVVSNQTLTAGDLDFSQQIGGNFRVVGGANYQRSSTTGPIQRRDNERYALEGGFGYFSPSGNSIALAYREARSKGLQDSFIFDDGMPIAYRSRNVDRAMLLQVEYVHSPVTRVDAQIGYGDHDDRSFLDADLDGLLADVSVTWSPRENLFIKPSFSRSFATENALYNNGVMVTRYGVETNGTLGPLLAWRARLSREIRKFRYDLAAPDPEALARTDRLTRFTLAADYPIRDRLRLGVQYDYFARSSSRDEFDFDSNAFMITLAYDIFRR